MPVDNDKETLAIVDTDDKQPLPGPLEVAKAVCTVFGAKKPPGLPGPPEDSSDTRQMPPGTTTTLVHTDTVQAGSYSNTSNTSNTSSTNMGDTDGGTTAMWAKLDLLCTEVSSAFAALRLWGFWAVAS